MPWPKVEDLELTMPKLLRFQTKVKPIKEDSHQDKAVNLVSPNSTRLEMSQLQDLANLANHPDLECRTPMPEWHKPCKEETSRIQP